MIGFIFIVIGVLWMLLFHKREERIVKDYTNTLLKEYEEDEEASNEEAENYITECTKSIWKNEVIFRGIPLGLILAGILVLISEFIR